MSGLACLPRWVWVASSFACVAFLAEPDSHASTPVSIYTAASRVEMLPTDANATEVAIHGAFMFINTSGGYSDAVCGVMYFNCPTGSESMCRMQWLDIRTMGTAASQCAGFGAQNVVSTARLRSEGPALSDPDTWDLGIGVQSGVYIDGKCAPAKALACAQPPSADGGAPDVPLSTDIRVMVDGTTSDESTAYETAAREVAGSEIADMTGASADRAPIDAVPIDAVRSYDAPPTDVPMVDAPIVPDLAVSAPDAGVDKNTGTTRDAAPEASNSVSETPSGGCTCRLGDARGDRRGGFLVGLALFGALVAAATRRARR